MRRTVAALLAAAFLALPAMAAPPRRQPSNAGALLYEALPLIRSSQNHLLVRAEINGKPALLGVDTGAPVSAVALEPARSFWIGADHGTLGHPLSAQH